jgi:hypothetical protein
MTITKYIGMDVHKESISIAVMNAAGKIVMECVIETKGSMLRIHESNTNPRRIFDECKLAELAESLRTQGLIQLITVRPNSDGYEIVAGARRFRAAHLGRCPVSLS